MIALEQLNALSSQEFVARLAGIFEHSAWIAQRAYAGTPFDSRLSLLDAMRSVVQQASSEEQLALINAHPKLGARGRARGQLTAASSREQQRAGLDACSDEEYAHLERINAAYIDKFEFPFILAVRGHDPPSILAQLQRRYGQDRVAELRTALHEIGVIAAYRLADAVSSTAAAEITAMLERWQRSAHMALLTEWMRAASLSVWADGEHRRIGIARSATRGVRTLLVGLHYDGVAGSLVSDGARGWITGIAVVQQLKERDVQLPFDLAVYADGRHDDRVTGLVAGHDQCRRLPLDAIDDTQPRNSELLAALRRAGLTNGDFVIASEGAIRSADALQEFLLHTPGAA